MSSPESKINAVENEANKNKAEAMKESPEAESLEDMQERMAADAEKMRKEIEEYSNPDSIVEEASSDIDLPPEVVKEEAQAMGLTDLLEDIKTEEKATEGELVGSATIPERPPVPPLTKAESVPAIDKEKLEEELKLKIEKYNKIRERVEGERAKNESSPESPANKLDEQEAKLLCKESVAGFEQRLRKNGLDEDKFLAILPDLYKKGKVTSENYAQYILMNALVGNSINVKKVNHIIENTPTEIIMSAAQGNAMLGGVLTNWRRQVSEEVKTRLGNKRPVAGVPRVDTPEIALKLAANIGRFVDAGHFPDKEIIQAGTKTIVEDFTKSYRGYNSLAVRVGNMNHFPAIENLYRAGFAEEALTLIKNSLEEGAMSPYYVTEMQIKGYLSEDQARDILDESGWLKKL